MRLLLRVLAAAFVVALSAPAARADAPFSFAATPGALPKDIVPVEYDLRLVPDLPARTFRGSQTVTLDVLRPTSQIVMHALALEVGAATLRRDGGATLPLGPARVDADRQMLVYTLAEPLAPGRYFLDMAWTGIVNPSPEGLYADPYPTAAGERTLLATDLEPTGARRILPCWDEPAFKARFRLSVELPEGDAAFANMPVARSEPLPGGRKRVTFEATPAMPSYLLALVAGELERLAGSADGTQIGIVFSAGKRGSADYALAASGELLRYYNGYFGQPYPLPKLDHIAIPGGFAGGMENWGAIVYNEARLLVDPAKTPERDRRIVFGIVAHETAHQWFGNLVTMAWWDNLWLNEAFAEWMSLKATDTLRPSWRVWLVTQEGRENAMDLDARATTHPIQQPVATESEAEDAFDDITYEKGAGFLRMLEDWLGEDVFRAGIRDYLARHRGSNTTGADLWAALAAASGKPVAAIASRWTQQGGFPLVVVDARCDAGRRRVELAQQPFRLEGGDAGAATLWPVPIRLGSLGTVGTTTLLEARRAELVLEGCDEPLLVDAGNVGFFRVRYAEPLFAALAARIASLPDAARLKLLSDASALAGAGQAPLADWFRLLPGFATEPRLALWSRLNADLQMFDRLCAGTPLRAELHRFAAALLRPRFAALGWDEKAGEPEEDRQVRSLLALALADQGDAAVIAEGRARFLRFAAEPTSIPLSQVDAVVAIAGRHADAATFDRLQQLAEQSLASADKFRYYRALAAVEDPALAERALAFALSPEVPQITRNRMLREVAGQGHVTLAWAFAQRHADALLADIKLFDGGRYFAQIVESSADPADAASLEAFAKARLPAGAAVEIGRAADEIRSRARLKARLLPELQAALARR